MPDAGCWFPVSGKYMVWRRAMSIVEFGSKFFIGILKFLLYRFETIDGSAFVSGAFQQAHLDALMQVTAGRSR
jgi:hypothetical protein